MVRWIEECITSPSFSICINGELKGFFLGGCISYKVILYCPICLFWWWSFFFFGGGSGIMEKKWLRATNLDSICSFSSMLCRWLNFCKGEMRWDLLLCSVIFGFDFRVMSGLVAKLEKSSLFTCGVARLVKEQLLSISGFKEWNLSIIYGYWFSLAALKLGRCIRSQSFSGGGFSHSALFFVVFRFGFGSSVLS